MKMVKVGIILLLLAIIGPEFGWSADRKARPTVQAVVLEEVDLTQTDILSAEDERAIERLAAETKDLDARYWATRVLNDKDVTLEDLKVYSEGWVGDGAEQYRLIEKYVLSGKVEPLTPEEHRALDAQNEKIRQILSPETKDDALLSALTQKECAELEARYWAHRAKTEAWYAPGWEDDWLWPKEYYLESGDKVVNLERNIRRKKQVRKLFLNYLKQSDIAPLTKKEEKAFNGCRYFDEQVASITRYPVYKYTGE